VVKQKEPWDIAKSYFGDVLGAREMRSKEPQAGEYYRN
jgi:hypothetical protein